MRQVSGKPPPVIGVDGARRDARRDEAGREGRGCRRTTRWANPRWRTQKPRKSRKAAISDEGVGLLVRARDTALGGIVKITALFAVLLALAVGSGAAMVASVHKEPVLLACGGPNC